MPTGGPKGGGPGVATPSKEGARAREAPRGSAGEAVARGGGAQRVGEGRSRASHNNTSPALPTPAPRPPAPRDPGCTHSGRGSVRAPSGCGVGGWRVCRSLSPGGPAPARPSSGPSTSSSAPTSGSPATQANGFRKSRLILRGLGVAARFPSLWALTASAQVSCHAPRGSLHCAPSCPLFARSLHKVGLCLSSSCIPPSCVHVASEWRWLLGQCGVTSH